MAGIISYEDGPSVKSTVLYKDNTALTVGGDTQWNDKDFNNTIYSIQAVVSEGMFSSIHFTFYAQRTQTDFYHRKKIGK